MDQLGVVYVPQMKQENVEEPVVEVVRLVPQDVCSEPASTLWMRWTILARLIG